MHAYIVGYANYDETSDVVEQWLNLTKFDIINSVLLTLVTPSQIDLFENNIENSVTTGFNEIRSIPMEYVSIIMSFILSLITFETGIFPDRLKVARICPVYM